MGVDLKGKDLGPNLSQRKKDGKYRACFITASGKRVDRIFDNVKEAKQWNGFKENNKRPNTVRNGNYPKLKKRNRTICNTISGKCIRRVCKKL